MTMIPAPPNLKPTIIQMRTSESATTSPNIQPNNPEEKEDQPKKRRRRSFSSLVSQSELEKRRREHKTSHSVIEKKRRIRMNREFEALKFLIPACRNSLVGGSSNNSGEGMYKLTILQATVDYIKYLHNVVNIQQDDLNEINGVDDNGEVDFAKIEIDTKGYRNVDNDFDFNQLFEDYSNRSSLLSESKRKSPPKINGLIMSSQQRQKRQQHDSNLGFQDLPSPIIIPELYTSTLSNPLSFPSALKQDFQFSSEPRNSFETGSKSSEFQLLSSQSIQKSLSQGSNTPNPRKLETIKELSQVKSSHLWEPRGSNLTSVSVVNRAGLDSLLESDSVNVLLSMRTNDVSSIRSLLN